MHILDNPLDGGGSQGHRSRMKWLFPVLLFGFAACSNGHAATPTDTPRPLPSPTPDICAPLRNNLASAQTDTAAKLFVLQLYEHGCLIGPTPVR